MFWDKVSPVYDFFENVYNKDVYNNIGRLVAEEITKSDIVLECACGTGAISRHIAPKCKFLVATDYSRGMLKQAFKKCQKYGNVKVQYADMFRLDCRSERFDVVVAGNVIHLLDKPEDAIKELMRVCREEGKVIIPTYINAEKKNNKMAVGILNKMGADFKRQFTLDEYKKFFSDLGYKNVEYKVAEGRMPCAIAVITK